MMNGPEKSASAIVATKPANKAEPSVERSAGEPYAAEPVERRAGTKGNAGQQSTRRTQSRESVSQALERIRKDARERNKEKFAALLHHKKRNGPTVKSRPTGSLRVTEIDHNPNYRYNPDYHFK